MLDKHETLGVEFIRGRNMWSSLVSNFINNHIDKCNLNKLFDYKVIPSSSVSETSILSSSIKKKVFLKSSLNIKGKQKDSSDVETFKYLIGDKGKNNCVIKASYVIPITEDDEYTDINNSLDIESQIYTHVVSEALKYTPCILNSYGSYKCNIDSINNLDKVMIGAKKDKKGRKYDIENNYDSDMMNLLILEKSSGLSLSKYLRDYHDDEEMMSVVFQLFWTIKVMSLLNLKHNDLHFGNIFVDYLEEPITLYFKLKKKKYVKLHTNVLVRIYDFDRGSAIGYPEVDRNIALDNFYCESFGECNDYFPMYDFWTLCVSLNDYNIKGFEFVESIIENLIDKGVYKGDYKGNSKKSGWNNKIHHLLPISDSHKKEKVNEILEGYTNLVFEIAEHMTIVKKPTKEAVIFKLPEKKEIPLYHPVCAYNDYELNESIKSYSNEDLSEEDKENIKMHKDNLSKYIKIIVQALKPDVWMIDINYDITKVSSELLGKYLERRNPLCLTKNKVEREFEYILISSVFLCWATYHKILGNHSIYKEEINSLLDVYITDIWNDYKNLIWYIDDFWKTFEGTLPVSIPNI